MPEQRCALLQSEVAELNRNLNEATRSLATASDAETQLRGELADSRAAIAECEAAQTALSLRLRRDAEAAAERAREEESECRLYASQVGCAIKMVIDL